MNSTSNLFQEIMGIEAISKLNADDISKLRELLGVFLELISRFGQMKADGSLDHLSLEDLNRASKVAASLWNVDVDRQQAMQITQKSASAFSSKICRSGIKPKKLSTFKYNDMIAIRDKKI